MPRASGSRPRRVLGTDHSAARVALSACADCPVRDLCLSVVDPERHWFDGVSGGRVWRNGRDVTASAVRQRAT
ncbi:hypothetical protein [Streptodolium elevatio]|uniref:4Fe-4S Wbl-type domain-containing protein n=1 Tax=Streptodolium elevatio TaxID=3157996 RepID=A0ABV3DF42_9ACTN